MGTPLRVGAGPQEAATLHRGSRVAQADFELLMLPPPPPQCRDDRCTSPRGWDPGSHPRSVSPLATEPNAHQGRLYDQSYTSCSWLCSGLSLPSFFSVHPHTLALPLALSSPHSPGSLGKVHSPQLGAGLSLLLAICSDRKSIFYICLHSETGQVSCHGALTQTSHSYSFIQASS